MLAYHPQALTDVVKSACDSETDCGPNMLLINDPDIVSGPMSVDPTEPPVANLSGYPFLSKSLEELGSFLGTIPEGWPISILRFLVADKQTAEDRTVLFVERGHKETEELQTWRLAAEHANAIPIAVQVSTMSISGVRAIADEDGVYRGGLARQQPTRGGPAPRKLLVSQGPDGFLKQFYI